MASSRVAASICAASLRIDAGANTLSTNRVQSAPNSSGARPSSVAAIAADCPSVSMAASNPVTVRNAATRSRSVAATAIPDEPKAPNSVRQANIPQISARRIVTPFL